jgi:subtilisin-like proprotein convertase family protein
MQTKSTLPGFRSLYFKLLVAVSFLISSLNTTQAQTTITTTYAFTSAQQCVTFNFKNTNATPVAITNIGGALNLNGGDGSTASVYYKTSAVNGLPGAITSANGWTQFGSSASVIANGLGTVQPLLATNLIVPPGATYGITVSAIDNADGVTGVIGYSNVNVGTSTISAGGGTFTTGPNEGYAGLLTGPTFTPRYFLGSITFGPPPACAALTAPTQPANATVMCGNNATFTLGGTGTAVTYQWQQRISATDQWTTVTNAAPFSGATTATLNIANAPASMSGYQYRVLYSGTCTPANFSNVVTLTVNPFVPTISPATAAICVGSIQKLSITNLSSPVAFSQTTASGAINLAIPDVGTSVGINHSIAVAALPVGSSVTGFNVTLNISHTYVGDLVIVLKAPNGQIFNLDYLLTATGGAGATVGFTNTVISSTGTAALESGTDPYTGTFAPDNQATAYVGYPLGPDGFIPTTRSLSTFLNSTATGGNWTIAIYDAGQPDAGILKNWSITVNYSVGVPETGIWGPVTGGNIFKDAAATIPYDSTQLNTVYVKPTATTNYTVAVNNGGTCDGTATVPVTVSNPITDATIPVANAATCAGNNASFTAASKTGVGVKHQWYVSTDNGATFAPIPSGGSYGATAVTGTLTVTGAALTMNNYKYKDSLYVTSCASYEFSNTATLTVNANPTIVLSAAPYKKLYPGLTTTITAAVSPNPASTYTWFRNGIAVPNVTGNSIVVDVDHLGSYTVTVNDVNTCSSTSSAISISDSSNTTLFIYPSPSTGQFTVRYYNNPPANRDGGVPGFVNVFDSKGARVWSKSYIVLGGYTRMDVDLTNFSKGIYRVELTDTKGVRIKTGSVVIF